MCVCVCVCVCDIETSKMGQPRPNFDCNAIENKMVSIINYFCETFFYCASIYT